jgi:hypothetical protein
MDDPMDNLIETFSEHLPRLRELREKMSAALETGQTSEAYEVIYPQLRIELALLKQPLEAFMDDWIEEKRPPLA